MRRPRLRGRRARRGLGWLAREGEKDEKEERKELLHDVGILFESEVVLSSREVSAEADSA
jgi:hypothetical protein